MNQVIYFASEFAFFLNRNCEKMFIEKIQAGTKRLGQCKEHSPALDSPTSKSCTSLKKNHSPPSYPSLTGRAEAVSWSCPWLYSSLVLVLWGEKKFFFGVGVALFYLLLALLRILAFFSSDSLYVSPFRAILGFSHRT